MSNPTPVPSLPDVAVADPMSGNADPRLPEEEKKKKRKRWKPPVVASTSTSSCPAENLSAPCTECGRSFNSAKALFGHMRCHPERQWRGINPPAARRLRLEEGQSTPEVVEAALTLMLISTGGAPAQEEAKFICTGCNREFGSYHALGGHRASHKNVKGCFANALEKKEDQEDGCSPRKVEKLERVRKEAGQEKVIIQGVAERLAMELDKHRPGNVKVYHSGEQIKTQSPNLSSISKIDPDPHFDLNLVPTSIDEGTDHDQKLITPEKQLGLDLRLGF